MNLIKLSLILYPALPGGPNYKKRPYWVYAMDTRQREVEADLLIRSRYLNFLLQKNIMSYEDDLSYEDYRKKVSVRVI